MTTLTPVKPAQEAELRRLEDWNARFLALAANLPSSEGARHHRVLAMMHEGTALVASAEEADIAAGRIREAVAPARTAYRESPFVAHLQDWPRGYQGDFECVEAICYPANRARPHTFGWYVEVAALNTQIAQQHRNKVARQAELIAETFLRNPEARVLVLACGCVPDARSVLPILLRSRGRLILNDMDGGALRCCREYLSALGDRVSFVEGNVLRLAPRLAAHGPFDLVLCGGLFDYLSDRQVAFVLARYAALLRGEDAPGRLFFTNVAAPNPYRPWMEYFADWRLIERGRDDLEAVREAAGLPPGCLRLSLDPSGLAWLAELELSAG